MSRPRIGIFYPYFVFTFCIGTQWLPHEFPQGLHDMMPIHWTAQNGHLDALKFLVGAGADISAKELMRTDACSVLGGWVREADAFALTESRLNVAF